MQTEARLNISKRNLKKALRSGLTAAGLVQLTYVNDQQPGILRRKSGKGFYYTFAARKVDDPAVLERIRKLVIPPAWENVWICKQANGHLQATGTDKQGRKQYRYHPSWSQVRNHTKFFRLLDFGKSLPQIRETLERHLGMQGYPREKILSAVVCLLEQTQIRIGNVFYEKLYGSFGLTTMKNRHVTIEGSKINFTFKGKKGVRHSIDLKSPKLARIIKACKEIPGKELFEYIDEEGEVHCVDSGMVNEYIRNISGGDFSAKDFRTWSGSVKALSVFRGIGPFESVADMNRKIPAVLDEVARYLGNTRSVCKKYYVHPGVVQLYMDQKLEQICARYDTDQNEGESRLSNDECMLLKILEKV